MTQNRCSSCGTEFGPDELFCPQCGMHVGSTQRCPRCNQPLAPGERFCGECGYEIVAQARKRHPWLWLGAGGVGLLGVAAIVVFLVLPNLRSQAVSTPTWTPTFAPTHTPAFITPAVAKTTVTLTPLAPSSPSPTATSVKKDTPALPTPTAGKLTPSPAPVTLTPTPTREAKGYRIAEGDWLSRIAESVYGDPLAYRAIVHYTNRRCSESGSPFHCVPDPDRIEVGWYLYLPTDQEIEEYWWAQYAGLPQCDPSQVTGEVEAIGSSTVYLITRRIGQRLAERGATLEPRVTSVGTTAGFERFCTQKQGDLVNASRPITAQERAACQANGRDPIELQIGTDALVIAVSAQNEFLTQLTTAQLQRAFTDALYWSDIDPTWPALPISRFIPGQDSGTFDFFVEAVLDGDSQALLSASGLTTSENDDLLVMGVAGDPAAIGFFGYAYYRDNSDRLRALLIDEIAPRQETADTGTYPLTRPLFVYTTADILNEKPHVAAFCNCYLQWVRDEILDVGYFMPDEEAFARSVTAFGQIYR